MSIAACVRGAAGAVLDGYIRDTEGIGKINFPVFCYGSYAQDQKGRGKVVDFRTPLQINGVTIQSGDIVFGDVDGVVVVPRQFEEGVVAQALEQVRKEKTAKHLLLKGVPAETVFRQTGVL
jgi:regulator of RNase E activity RraA